MKQRLLTLAILASLSSSSFADDISYDHTNTANQATIDIAQVSTTSDLTQDSASLLTGINTQINIAVGGNSILNTYSIDQSAATGGSIANLALEAQDSNANPFYGDVKTGRVEDNSQAATGLVTQNTTDTTTNNTITMSQAGDKDIASLSVAGGGNIISLAQSNANNFADVIVDGSNNTLTITQDTANATLATAIRSNGLNLTIAQ